METLLISFQDPLLIYMLLEQKMNRTKFVDLNFFYNFHFPSFSVGHVLVF